MQDLPFSGRIPSLDPSSQCETPATISTEQSTCEKIKSRCQNRAETKKLPENNVKLVDHEIKQVPRHLSSALLVHESTVVGDFPVAKTVFAFFSCLIDRDG